MLEKTGSRLKTDGSCRNTLHEDNTTTSSKAVLIFVEVRYRSSERHGSPAETVDRRKQEKILKTARAYLTKHTEFGDLPVRFDVVAVTKRNYRPNILWIRDAFQ